MQQTLVLKNAWIKLLIILVYIVAYGVLNILGTDGQQKLSFDNPETLLLLKILQVFAVIVVFILPAFLFAHFYAESKIAFLGITTRPSFFSLVLAGMAMLMALPLINFLAAVNEGMKLPEYFSGMEAWMKRSEANAGALSKAFLSGTSTMDLFLNFFVIAFMAALSEELFFRGLLQNVLLGATRNIHVAVWTAGIIFSAFHLQFFGFIPRALMGVFLGYTYFFTGSLWVPIFAHFMNNAVAVLISFLIKSGSLNPAVENVGSSENELSYIVTSSMIVFLLTWGIYAWEKKRKRGLITETGENF